MKALHSQPVTTIRPTGSASRRGLARRVTRVRIAGASAIALGLSLTTAPLVAQADDQEATVYPVTVNAVIEDGDASAALPGLAITVSTTDRDQIIGSGVTDLAGDLHLDIAGTHTLYIADALWPGAIGELEWAEAAVEFPVAAAEPVRVAIAGPFGTVSGTVTATSGGQPVADLSGALLAISSGGVEVQRVPIAADGSFVSAALPATQASDYSVALIPPAGYQLDEQAPPTNTPFALPRGQVSPVAIQIAPAFALTSDGTPPSTPEPSQPPTDVPTQTALPTSPSAEPTPSADPTPSAVPTASPTLAGTGGSGSVTFSGAADLSSVYADSTDEQFDSLLDETAANPGQLVGITNGSGQLIGLATAPDDQERQAIIEALAPITDPMEGVTVDDISQLSISLQDSLLALQQQREQVLQSSLSAQLTQAQDRNARIAALESALTALDAFLAAPTDAAAYTTATDTLKASGISHAFLEAAESADRVEQATSLATELRQDLAAIRTAQQQDLTNLTSLTDKREAAYDAMTALLAKMEQARSQITGVMRSTPVQLGTVQWDSGVVTGGFDLSSVPNGKHHLIVHVAETGLYVVAEVTVDKTAATGSTQAAVARELAETGTAAPGLLGAGLGLIGLGLAMLIGAPVLRRTWSGTLRR